MGARGARRNESRASVKVTVGHVVLRSFSLAYLWRHVYICVYICVCARVCVTLSTCMRECVRVSALRASLVRKGGERETKCEWVKVCVTCACVHMCIERE